MSYENVSGQRLLFGRIYHLWPGLTGSESQQNAIYKVLSTRFFVQYNYMRKSFDHVIFLDLESAILLTQLFHDFDGTTLLMVQQKLARK